MSVNFDGDVNAGVCAPAMAYRAAALEGNRLMLIDRGGTSRNAGADSGWPLIPGFADGRRLALLRGVPA
jgi:hypothetical protein